MIFAEVFAGTGGVEVTQCGVIDVVNGFVPCQNFFKAEFAFAVGVDRLLGGIFGYGHAFGFAKGRSGTGKYYALDLAGKLSSSGALSSLFSSQEKEEPAPETEKKSTTQAVVAKPKGKPSADLWRHRKLIEALSLYVSEDKREKFELVLKLFDLMELAGNLKH